MPRGQDVLPPPSPAREWLLTDGAGGCARGVATGVPSRRAHALLHAPDSTGLVTTVLLGFDERFHVDRATFHLFAPSNTRESPEAAESAEIEAFSADPCPTWRLRCGEVVLEKSLFMLQGHPAVALAWRHLAGPAGRLRLGPWVVARDTGSLQRETPEMRGVVQGIPGRVRIETLQGRPALTLWYNGSFLPVRQWHRGIEYPGDPREKPAAREDAFIPGHIDCALEPGGAVHVVASTEEALFRTLAVEGRLGAPPPATLADCVTLLGQTERTHLASIVTVALRGADYTARQAAAAHGHEARSRQATPLVEPNDGWTARLVRAVLRGVVVRSGRPTVLDAFPEASESATEALRALPGLVAIRAFDTARGVMRGYLEYLDDGLAPMRIAPDGTPEYGDPEPSLWLVHVAELIARRSEESEWARDVLQPLEGIFQFYRNGTRHCVRADQDGLLSVGEGGRETSPARLNVLWYHALVAMAQIARFAGRKESAAFYLAWARQHGQSFNDRLWDERGGCLYEAWSEDGEQPGFSPAQLLAISLAPSILPPERAARLLERVERELCTPFGLRSRIDATRVETGWLGAYHSAVFRVHGHDPGAQARVASGLDALRNALEEATVEHVPAAFEAAPGPGRRAPGKTSGNAVVRWIPVGTSTVAAAELLRAWIEEVEHVEPAAVG